MNDRFKFRVFDYDDNKMHDVIEIMYREDNTVVEWLNSEDKKRSAFIGEVPTVQCTGLKDKNGKLIYEGDIVDIWKMAGNIHKRMVVKWYQPQCSFRLFDLSAMGATPQKMVDKRSLGAVTTIEVIGNIYENKELIEEYKDE